MIMKILRTRCVLAVLAAVLIFGGAFFSDLKAQGSSEYTALLENSQYFSFGDNGVEIEKLQTLLNELGYYQGAIDGDFGLKTQASVVQFQKESGLGQDGIVGPATKAVLKKHESRINPPEQHIVSSGETLLVIADKYGISVADLVSINQLRNPDRIFPGDTLLLRSKGTAVGQENPNSQENEGSKEFTEPVKPVDVPPPFEPFPVPDKRVCLTFNDGPDPDTTPLILDALDEYGIKAVFFLIGERVAQYPDLANAIAQKGHVIGVHGYKHEILAGLTAVEVHQDLSKARQTIINHTGQTPHLYRPPGGALDEVQVKEANKLGMTVLMWTNIGGADLGASSPDEVTERVIKGARDGSIILLHEGLIHSAKALSKIIPSLARAGFGFQNLGSAPVTGPVPEQ